MALDDIGHLGQIFVHQMHQVVGRHFLGNLREAFDVGEKYCHVTDLAAEFRQLVRLQHPVNDIRREVERKAFYQ